MLGNITFLDLSFDCRIRVLAPYLQRLSAKSLEPGQQIKSISFEHSRHQTERTGSHRLNPINPAKTSALGWFGEYISCVVDFPDLGSRAKYNRQCMINLLSSNTIPYHAQP